MELTLGLLPFVSLSNTRRFCKVRDGYSFGMMDYRSCFPLKTKLMISSALPETVASVAIAATVVGTAVSFFLIRRTTAALEVTEASTRECEACGGSGICPSCKGEGFVVKRLTDSSADKARLNAKNVATRYTAGLPRKWSYCSKCSSSRSCTTCYGSGKISL